MFYQVTAERIVTSFLFALLLRPFILHVAPVSGPNHSSKQIRENAAIDPYGLRVKVEFVIPVEKEKEKKKNQAWRNPSSSRLPESSCPLTFWLLTERTVEGWEQKWRHALKVLVL